MTKYYKSHYVNSTNGRVDINLSDSGVIITQQTEGRVAGAISITSEEMEKLAKVLFAIKKEAFPVSPQSPAISVPSSTNTPNYSNTSTDKLTIRILMALVIVHLSYKIYKEITA